MFFKWIHFNFIFYVYIININDMYCSKSPINERLITKIVSINDNKKNISTTNYSLNQHIFDPSKSSPPNEFMLKLQQRMSVYGNSTVVSTVVSGMVRGKTVHI